MIIYINTLKYRFDLYAPSFHGKPFFCMLRKGENSFFVRRHFITRYTLFIFNAFVTMTEWSSLTTYENLIKLMIYHITISISIIPFIHLIKKNGKFYYSASNIIFINILLPVFICNFRSVVYISRQSLYIQTHRF